MKAYQKQKQGFTLIEILLVITILAVFAGIIFVALNPSKRIKDAKDSRRASDVDSLLTAVHQYIIDNKGTVPAGIDTTLRQLGTGASGCTISNTFCTVTPTACLDLSAATLLGKYLKSVPVDPNGTAAQTQYAVTADVNGIVTVTACGTEGATVINAAR